MSVNASIPSWKRAFVRAVCWHGSRLRGRVPQAHTGADEIKVLIRHIVQGRDEPFDANVIDATPSRAAARFPMYGIRGVPQRRSACGLRACKCLSVLVAMVRDVLRSRGFAELTMRTEFS